MELKTTYRPFAERDPAWMTPTAGVPLELTDARVVRTGPAAADWNAPTTPEKAIVTAMTAEVNVWMRFVFMVAN
jgi:hypothetical protein